MATIKFFTRSSKSDKSSIYVRIINGRNYDLRLRTPFEVDPDQWDDETQKQKNPYKSTPKNVKGKTHLKEIITLNNSLQLMESDINIFFITNPTAGKDEVKKFFNDEYFPKKKQPAKSKKNDVSTLFIDLVDLYLKEKSRYITGKQKPITGSTHKRITTQKNRILRYSPKLLISQIDDSFRDEFTEWMQKENYSEYTIIKDLKYLKTICRYFAKKTPVSNDVLTWEFAQTEKKYPYPVLSLPEINQIKNTILPNDGYLDNARDWLIIGCYTGQRVSDLLRFNSKMIVDKQYLKFIQKKTQNKIIVYLADPVLRILNKRDGEFPRKISDQKFNKYIKEVCKIAGIDEMMEGGKIGNDHKKEIGIYPKYELVSSHICRRSFVTNFLNGMDKETIAKQTGHHSSKMVESYDGTKEDERLMNNARDVAKQMNSFLKVVL